MLRNIAIFSILSWACLSSAGCSSGPVKETGAPPTAAKSDAPPRNTVNNAVNNAATGQKEAGSPDDAACYAFKREGMKLLKSQTFAIDFEPFKKSCFVTFYGAEFSSPPLGGQFYIYKNGKEVLNFPDQFNGGNALCWVDAVSFEDLNGDGLKDIIVVGKCGAKTEAYNENMVYINNGDDFSIDKDADTDLMDFSKTSEIKQYVTEHEAKFKAEK